MSKAHRGSELRREVPRSGRGTCPVTHKSGVKLLFDYDIDGTTTKISKYGKAILENRRLRKEREAKRKAQAVVEQKSTDGNDVSPSAPATTDGATPSTTSEQDVSNTQDASGGQDATVATANTDSNE